MELVWNRAFRQPLPSITLLQNAAILQVIDLISKGFHGQVVGGDQNSRPVLVSAMRRKSCRICWPVARTACCDRGSPPTGLAVARRRGEHHSPFRTFAPHSDWSEALRTRRARPAYQHLRPAAATATAEGGHPGTFTRDHARDRKARNLCAPRVGTVSIEAVGLCAA